MWLRAVSAVVAVVLFVSCCSGTEENELWLLLSSFEDLGITVKDLAFFVVAHGYNAEPTNDAYVTVKLSSGKEIYLTPNGASSGLADLWMTPPTQTSGPVRISHKEKSDLQQSHKPRFYKNSHKNANISSCPSGNVL